MTDFLFPYCVFLAAITSHSITGADDSKGDCIPVDDANGTYVSCDIQNGMCGQTNITQISDNLDWQCFANCPTGPWPQVNISYSTRQTGNRVFAILDSPLLCPTGIDVYRLSFGYVWGLDVPTGVRLSVAMTDEHGQEPRSLWETGNNATPSDNITISCPDCKFRLHFETSMSSGSQAHVSLGYISLNYTGRALPFSPPSTDKLVAMILAVIVFFCALPVIVIVCIAICWWWRKKTDGSNVDTRREETAKEVVKNPNGGTATTAKGTGSRSTSNTSGGSHSTANTSGGSRSTTNTSGGSRTTINTSGGSSGDSHSTTNTSGGPHSTTNTSGGPRTTSDANASSASGGRPPSYVPNYLQLSGDLEGAENRPTSYYSGLYDDMYEHEYNEATSNNYENTDFPNPARPLPSTPS